MSLIDDIAPLQIDLETIPPVPECLRQRVINLGASPEPQLQMIWNPQTWIKWLHDLPGATTYLETLAQRMTKKYGKPALDRNDVLLEVKSQNTANQTHLAFIVVMIWGYGTGGLGPYRTSKILRQSETGTNDPFSETTLESLSNAANVASGGPSEVLGFYILNNAPTKIKHLGPAFFTKWLSFVSMQNNPDEERALPILDDVVAVWIKRHTATTNSAGLDLNPQKSRATTRYHQYLQLLDEWTAQLPHPYTRTQIERTIFTSRAWDKSCSDFTKKY